MEEPEDSAADNHASQQTTASRSPAPESQPNVFSTMRSTAHGSEPEKAESILASLLGDFSEEEEEEDSQRCAHVLKTHAQPPASVYVPPLPSLSVLEVEKKVRKESEELEAQGRATSIHSQPNEIDDNSVTIRIGKAIAPLVQASTKSGASLSGVGSSQAKASDYENIQSESDHQSHAAAGCLDAESNPQLPSGSNCITDEKRRAEFIRIVENVLWEEHMNALNHGSMASSRDSDESLPRKFGELGPTMTPSELAQALITKFGNPELKLLELSKSLEPPVPLLGQASDSMQTKLSTPVQGTTYTSNKVVSSGSRASHALTASPDSESDSVSERFCEDEDDQESPQQEMREIEGVDEVDLEQEAMLQALTRSERSPYSVDAATQAKTAQVKPLFRDLGDDLGIDELEDGDINGQLLDAVYATAQGNCHDGHGSRADLDQRDVGRAFLAESISDEIVTEIAEPFTEPSDEEGT